MKTSTATPRALILALTFAAASPPAARGVEPSEAGDAPATSASVPRPARPPSADREAPRWVTVTTTLLLTEMLAAGASLLAARYPEGTGWTLVGISPLLFANMQPPDPIPYTSVFAAGTVGLGLYDALELRGTGHSRTERFWWNFAGWHAIALGSELTARLLAHRGSASTPPAPALSFSVGPTGGGVRVALGGRF